ncbi:MAG: methyltransferase [Candidatus Electrothrix sp. AU1_5]|jgi:hypothetical protein|nr:methyltransferase [Candidatus Electrothrix gigas]MCI5193159.1 methyltransferase [Candidatus Electrothrix gigas]
MSENIIGIRETLLYIYDQIKGMSDEQILTGKTDVLKPCFNELDRLAARHVTQEIVKEISESAEFAPALSVISRLRNLYNLRLEIEQAHALLDSADPWARIKDFTFYANYIQLAAMEQKGAKLKPQDRIIFLGSGPLPLSLIILCSLYDLQGVGIEQEASSVALSRQVVQHLGLEQQIQIICGDHFLLPLEEETQLLMVAAMARPKREIFAHLAQVLPEGDLISFRLYEKGLRKILDQEEDVVLPEGFTAHCRICPHPPVNNTVIMIKKSFSDP